METNQVAGVVGKRLDATKGGQQSQTIDRQLIGIALRNYGIVVWIASFDETAGQNTVAIVDFRIAVVESDAYVAAVLAQNVLEQRCGLLRQNERCWCLAVDGEHLVAHQLVAVAGYNGKALCRQVKVDAVHDRAQFVLGRSENGTVDVLGQHGIRHRNDIGVLANLLCLRIFIGIFNRQREQTVLVSNLSHVLVLVDVERNGLLRETLDGFQQIVIANGKTGFAFAFNQFQACFHHVLAVRCRQLQCVA